MKSSIKILVLISLILLTFQAALGNTATITISDEVQVSEETIILGNIAQITGSQDMISLLQAIEIRKSPQPGYSANVSKSHLEYVIKQKGIDVSTINFNVPQNFKVTRRSQKITQSDLSECAVSFIKDMMPWEEDDVTITVQSSQNEITLPEGELELLPSCSNNIKFIGNTSVTVEVIVNGSSIRKTNVSLKIQVFSEVLVAKSNIQRGDPLTTENTGLEKREIKQYSNNVFTDTGIIEGKVAAVNISNGTIINERLLEIPLAIHSGDTVTIIATTGQVEVRAEGKARQNGRMGETISVVNTGSGKKLQATVIDEGTVLIEVK